MPSIPTDVEVPRASEDMGRAEQANIGERGERGRGDWDAVEKLLIYLSKRRSGVTAAAEQV